MLGEGAFLFMEALLDVSKVSNDDGKACAQLMNFLKLGKWELSGSDADVLYRTKAWVMELARKMAADLKSQPPISGPAPSPASSSNGFKVKAMGPIGKPPRKKK